jgi:diguanylate cyclase (GGDEF)-like protein/PAS domain S-box-containing protein
MSMSRMRALLLCRHTPLLILGLFVAYAAVLLWNVLASQSALREVTERRLVADTERRAAVISDFIDERIRNVAQIASVREIEDYFVNADLGMSPRYGLNASLDAIDRRLAEQLREATLRDVPVFRSLRLIEGSGRVLAAAGGAPQRAPILTDVDGPRLRMDCGNRCFEIVAPVLFRGAPRAFLVAVGSLDTLGALLIDAREGKRGPEQEAVRYAELVLGVGGAPLASSAPALVLSPGSLEALAAAGAGAVVPATMLADTPGLAPDMLLVRAQVPHTDLSVLTLIAREDARGQVISTAVIGMMMAFPLALVALWLAFLRQRRRAERLRSDIRTAVQHRSRLEADNAALAAEVARREAAEARLSERTAELTRSNAELRQLAMVFTYAREGISITDADGTILEVNDAFCRLSGYAREELLGQNPRMLKSGRQRPEHYAQMWQALREHGHWHGEIWNRRKDGSLYAELLTISAVRDDDGRIQCYVALFSDITAQKSHQQQLERIAHYDALTGLANRSLLADRLHQSMVMSLRRGTRLAIVYLDLDGFKAVNDRHGHDMGDRLLMGVSQRMHAVLREGDTLARLGGDEFVAVLQDMPTVEACVPLLNRLLEAASTPWVEEDCELRVSASLGVTFFPQADPVDADQLLRQADQAMYQAKLQGKDRYYLFDAEQDRAVRDSHEGRERIRQALQAGEFVLFYQPKVNMRSGAVLGLEALIRWRHPERGLLPPAAFLPLIEEHPLAVAVGAWVLDSAFAQVSSWQAQGLRLSVSVNVSARQLEQTDFVAGLRQRFEAYPHVRPEQIELEVLESSALDDIAEVSSIMHACQSLGVRFALDDFGTGYCSLTYLKNLPANTLKIDRSFVRDMLDDPEDLAILEGVIGLAGAFSRQTVAEGVETVLHGELLLDLGCEIAQGYGIARPMAADDVPGWVRGWRPGPSWLDRPRVEHDELPRMFAIAHHRAWVARIEAYLLSQAGTLAPPATDDQCALGMWLEDEGRLRHGNDPALDEALAMHDRVHELAHELMTRRATAPIPDNDAGLLALRALRDHLIERLGRLR